MRVLVSDLKNHHIDAQVSIQGRVHRIRDLKSVNFIIVKDRTGIVQTVAPKSLDISKLSSESVVKITGKCVADARSKVGVEIQVETIGLISEAQTYLPLDLNLPLEAGNQTLLDNRPVALRHEEMQRVCKTQAQILKRFRSTLNELGFTEIITPKLVLAGAEGGSALFEVKYFDKKAYLNQSPQFYKQIMAGTDLERVFEVGHAYRAENSESNRHLTEFVSLDVEMAYIEDVQTIIDLEIRILEDICYDLKIGFNYQIIDFKEAKRILKEIGINAEHDLNAEQERLIGEHFKTASDFVFITGYSDEVRPFYAMPGQTFDLLYKGVEITSGGQRIHDYNQLVERMQSRGMNVEDFADYLQTFKYGMPPHGGFGLGLERLTWLMLGLGNVKEACLFPRDKHRLRP